MQWIIEIPDITVNVCFDYFGKLPDPPRGHSTEIARQMIISSAAFMIEHPDKAKDEQAVALSGLLGRDQGLPGDPEAGLRVALGANGQTGPNARAGKLDDYVADTRRKCAQDNEEPDPDTMRTQARNRTRKGRSR